jgi:2-amino-4-hydroxy-6-hydroxymethyldihydropteridine diphosphokinase
MNHQAFLLLGSNMGNRMQYLESAANAIEQLCGNIKRSSKVYESPPWGFEAVQNFYNQALLIETKLEAKDLLKHLLAIEKKMGRSRNGQAYTSRVIDIDILYFDRYNIDLKELVIPHPRLHLRRFALLPLVEIAPDFVHPVLHITNLKLLENSDDKSDVKSVNNF